MLPPSKQAEAGAVALRALTAGRKAATGACRAALRWSASELPQTRAGIQRTPPKGADRGEGSRGKPLTGAITLPCPQAMLGHDTLVPATGSASVHILSSACWDRVASWCSASRNFT